MGILILKKLFQSTIYLGIISLLFQSCDFNDLEIIYEEKLVVFASIVANMPVTDTVFVSRSASVDEDISANQLWIDDADVRLIHDSSSAELVFHSVGNGRYFPILPDAGMEEILDYLNYIIQPGDTYRLVVVHDQDSVIATTEVPTTFNIAPADIGEYGCPDGEMLPVGNVDVNNLNDLSPAQLFELFQNPEGFVNTNNINVDSVVFRFGDCFTKSFASYPMFGIDFNDDDFNTIQIISLALEANSVGLEPELDFNNDGSIDENEFSDRNRNGIRDSCYINLIYNEQKAKYFDNDSLSYNDIARIWKSPLRRETQQGSWRENSPYRYNPWLWNSESAPTVVMWLYFDYYGYYLMTFNATSEAYFNYFSGDPVGQNIYLLPDTNLDGGLGVFYSSVATSFLVYVKKDER